jgi:hypothetical protein
MCSSTSRTLTTWLSGCGEDVAGDKEVLLIQQVSRFTVARFVISQCRRNLEIQCESHNFGVMLGRSGGGIRDNREIGG